jgi:resolvase-like protein
MTRREPAHGSVRLLPGVVETASAVAATAPPSGRSWTGSAQVTPWLCGNWIGIGFRSRQEAIDTTTPGGKLVFHVLAALAEFERDLIRERTGAALAAASARGRQTAGPPS